MNIIQKEVLLLKAQDDEGNDKYESILTENGFTAKHLQILSFEYINTSVLKKKLNNVDNYNGIIFTSPRAVHATKLMVNNEKLDEKWSNKDNYVVGESTFNLVQKELGLICKGRESGNANNLAELIIQENCSENIKKFIFPCGNLKKETLGNRLKENNIEVDAVTVYETIQNPNIKENFKVISCNYKNISEYLVYFSPSGVKYTTSIFKELNVPFDKLKLVTIGPSTEEALNMENLPVYSVAKKPTNTELLNAILKKS